MNADESGKLWEANAEAWTVMSRAGYDVFRDLFNTPTFLQILPPIDGLIGLDIGCGEGHNTRLLAGQGARMRAVDIAQTFIRYAREAEAAAPFGIEYQVASALDLPFDDAQFDFATAFMSFQDMPEQAACRTDEWTFGAAPPEVHSRYPKFRIAYFDHTLSEWLNMLLRAGFQLEAFAEPSPTAEVLQRHPHLYDARIIAYFLIVRARKPSGMPAD